MYALISPNESAQYISSWTTGLKQYPIYTQIGQRVAQVQSTEFPVANPLFWVSCADNIVADKYYFDPNTQTIIVIPPDAPRPS